MRTKRALVQALGVVVALSLLIVGGIGYLHTAEGRKLPIARTLLSWIGVECPLGRGLSAETVEASRQKGVSAYQGTAQAPARPALGLVLDVSTEADGKAWASRMNLECEKVVKGEVFLKCREKNTPATYTLAFKPNGKLAALDVFRRNVSRKSIQPLLDASKKYLSEQLGSPQEHRGELEGDFLLHGNGLNTAYVRYKFKDYVATVTAAYLPWSGLMLHEQYSSVGI